MLKSSIANIDDDDDNNIDDDGDNRIEEKQWRKITKYKNLEIEIQCLWGKKTISIPTVTGGLGVIPKTKRELIRYNIKQLFHDMKIIPMLILLPQSYTLHQLFHAKHTGRLMHQI